MGFVGTKMVHLHLQNTIRFVLRPVMDKYDMEHEEPLGRSHDNIASLDEQTPHMPYRTMCQSGYYKIRITYILRHLTDTVYTCYCSEVYNHKSRITLS